jgi:hypothetical protein
MLGHQTPATLVRKNPKLTPAVPHPSHNLLDPSGAIQKPKSAPLKTETPRENSGHLV